MINNNNPILIQNQPIILKYIRQHIQDENNNPSKVTTLSLKNCKVSKIAYLQLLPNLMIVDLRNNNILQMIGFQQCNNITQLHLCQNLISKIKRIHNLKKLKIIDLRGNHIRDLNNTITNLPESVVQFKARCNHITNIEQIWKLENKFQVIWLDQNLFVSNSKNYFKGIFEIKVWNLHDFWI